MKLLNFIKSLFNLYHPLLDPMGLMYNLPRKKWEFDKAYRKRIIENIEAPIRPYKRSWPLWDEESRPH